MSVYRENANVHLNEADRLKGLADKMVETQKKEALSLIDTAVSAVISAAEKQAEAGGYYMPYKLCEHVPVYTKESARIIKAKLESKGFWFTDTDYVLIRWGGKRP